LHRDAYCQPTAVAFGGRQVACGVADRIENRPLNRVAELGELVVKV
jgi:hypothetical protein